MNVCFKLVANKTLGRVFGDREKRQKDIQMLQRMTFRVEWREWPLGVLLSNWAVLAVWLVGLQLLRKPGRLSG